MNKLKLFILFLLLNKSLLLFASDNLYTNYELGFSFKYPSNVELGYIYSGDNIYKLKETFKIDFYITNINEFNADPNVSANLYDEFKKVQEKKGFLWESKEKFKNIANEYFKYDKNIIGQIDFKLDTPEANQVYSKILTIKIENYLINISVNYFDYPAYSIPERYPEYFDIKEYYVKKKNGEKLLVKDTPEWKDPIEKNYVEFYNLIKNKSKKAPEELVKLWEYFDVIINSLELFAPAKYVTPSVNKLSLRKGSSTNDERIRLISQGEKLEILDDINPPELVGKDYGFWVKVKTEKGEVGWCFDAYLEEVKKK